MRVIFWCNLANIDTPYDIPKLLWESFDHDPVLPQCLGNLWMWKRGTILCEPSKLMVTTNLNPLHIPTCGIGGVNNVFPLCSTLKVLLIHLQSSSHPFNCYAYIDLILFEQLSYVLPLLFWRSPFILDEYKFHWNLWQFYWTECPLTFTIAPTVLLCWSWMLEVPTKAFQFLEAS